MNLDNNISIQHLNKFLKKWYKNLSAAPWHDTHKSQGGYFGYWSFEAASAVVLLEIEDDSSFHQYKYYPKDLVKFAREFVLANNETS